MALRVWPNIWLSRSDEFDVQLSQLIKVSAILEDWDHNFLEVQNNRETSCFSQNPSKALRTLDLADLAILCCRIGPKLDACPVRIRNSW